MADARPDGGAPGAAAWEAAAPGLLPEAVVEAYRCMVRARHLERTGWDLVRQNRVHFAIASPGHEGVAAGYALAMDPARDYLAPHYRDVAALLYLGMPPLRPLSTLYGRSTGVSRGRQPYGYWGWAAQRVLTASGPQPNHLTQGVGVALGSKFLGDGAVTWVTFGDGGASRGEFHEGLNFAAIHRCPVVFLCENNGYTQSVPLAQQSALPDIARRADAYGIPGVTVDGMDALAVYRAARTARHRAAAGEGPTLLEAKTYRYLPNTSNDDDRRYRDRAEVQAWLARDPVPGLARRLVELGALTEAEVARIDADAAAEIAAAAREAEAAPPPDPAEAFQHSYGEPTASPRAGG